MVTNDVAIGHCWWTLPFKVFLKYLKLPIRNKKEKKLDDVQDEEDLAQGFVQRLCVFEDVRCTLFSRRSVTMGLWL